MNILGVRQPAFSTKPEQIQNVVKSGTTLPVFEKSAVHAAARAALKPLNDVNAFTDEMAEEWLNSKAGGQLRNLLRDYVQHGCTKSLES